MQKMNKLFFIFSLLLFPILSKAGEINGVVTDEDGPVVGASVLLNERSGVVTDQDGRFSFSELDAGNHDIKVQFIGYRIWSEQINAPKCYGSQQN